MQPPSISTGCHFLMSNLIYFHFVHANHSHSISVQSFLNGQMARRLSFFNFDFAGVGSKVPKKHDHFLCFDRNKKTIIEFSHIFSFKCWKTSFASILMNQSPLTNKKNSQKQALSMVHSHRYTYQTLTHTTINLKKSNIYAHTHTHINFNDL